jgi:hypothetical protein
VGCFTIDPGFVLHEMNQTGADMLGVARDDAYGLPLDAFFCAESARRFKSAISGLDASTRRPSLQSSCASPSSGPERQVVASISADPAARRFLVSLTEAVLVQRFGQHRLADEAVHAGLQAARLVLAEDIGGHGQMGVAACRGSSRMRRAASSPSILGICMSIRIRW